MTEPVEMTVEDLIETYGPIDHVTIGINGGFHSVSLRHEGGSSLSSGYQHHDPRPFPHLMKGVTIEIFDMVSAGHTCPQCGAAAGERCQDVKTRHRARITAARGCETCNDNDFYFGHPTRIRIAAVESEDR